MSAAFDSLRDWFGRAMIVDIVGDAEAYEVDRGESDGFTLSQIELVMQMAGVGEIKFL